MDIDALAGLRGRPVPGGCYTIDPAEHAEVLRSVAARPRSDGSAHPIYAYIAAQRAMGWTVDEFLRVCDSKPEDGPLMAGCRFVFARSLRVGATYAVTGEITDAERKTGRRTGVFDLVSFQLRLACQEEPAVTMASTWVLPRRDP